MDKTLIITQSNYIPWKGYFDLLRNADVFVVFDEVQYTKRDWRNRNKLICNNGPKWLSIPVKTKNNFSQKISRTEVLNDNWINDHLNFIENNYRRAKCFDEYFPIIKSIIVESQNKYLSKINVKIIKNLLDLLGISIEIIDSSQLELAEEKNDKLISVCNQLNIKNYITGPSALSYIDEKKFIESNISIRVFEYKNYKQYEQLWNGFDHNVSIIDMFLNLGIKTKDYL